MHLRTAPGVRIKRRVGSNTFLKVFLSTKQVETNECEASESNNMVTRVEFTRNSPYMTSGAACTSSTFTWFTWPCPKFGALVLCGPEFYGAMRLTPKVVVLLLAIG